jgi:hypothetical protein
VENLFFTTAKQAHAVSSFSPISGPFPPSTIFSKRPSADLSFFSQCDLSACPRSYKAMESSRFTSPCSRRETMASNSFSAPSKESSSTALSVPFGDVWAGMAVLQLFYFRMPPKPQSTIIAVTMVSDQLRAPAQHEIIVQGIRGTSSFLAKDIGRCLVTRSPNRTLTDLQRGADALYRCENNPVS